MQVWTQVKVTADGKFKGAAGLVIRVEAEGDAVLATVKLDEYDKPEVFAASELQILG